MLSGVATGDLNGDRMADQVVTSGGSHNVTVLLGDGLGGFTQPLTSPEGVGLDSPRDPHIVDIDRDGDKDIVVVCSAGPTPGVYVLLGDGTGAFTAALTSPEQAFDGDGILDQALTELTLNDAHVLLGEGNGDFNAAPSGTENTGTSPVGAVAADFDGNGKPDLAVVNQTTSNLTILLGAAAGDFTAAGTEAVSGTAPTAVTVADVNRDGDEDSDDDADRVADSSDKCRVIAPVSASGCPAVKRTLKLSYSKRRRRFSGTLTATGAPGCAAAKRVTMFQDRPGRDRRIGRAKTNAVGKFKLRKRTKRGVYYASVATVTVRDVGDCSAAISKPVRRR